jgi:hypothetical protein
MFLWCQRCEHTYRAEDWTMYGRFKYGVCPNVRCSARGFTNALEWSEIAKANGYPPAPAIGSHYPLYNQDLLEDSIWQGT